MKKLTQIFAILLPILVGACTSDEFDNPNVSVGNEVSVIEAIMTPFGDVQSESRTAIDMSDSKVNSLVWAEGDTIGIYPSAGGDQLSFPITDGIGTGTCVFTGGGWALKTSTATETYTYTAYSPFKRNYYLLKDNTALPINMLGQKQNGNDNSKHLGAYHIQIASGDTPTSGKISFKFKHKVSFVRMDITAPCAATWKSIELESDAAFTTKAAMNLSLATPTVTPTAQSNSVTLELENVKTTESDLSIVAYMMMLPVDFNDKTLTMYLTDIDGRVYSASVEIRNPNNAANPKLFGEATSRWISAEFKEIPYVTFAAEATQTLTLSKEVQTLEYSVGGSKWKTLGTTTVTFGGSNGELRLRGKSLTGTASNYNDYSNIKFGNSVPVACSGDIRTLVDYENYKTTDTSEARFCRLFEDCSSLTSSPELPATTLAFQCYIGMFQGCSSLTSTSSLPATTLAEYCYSSMFEGCSSLKSTPSLPATTLAKNCYADMFAYCSSLTNAPSLPATTLAEHCYNHMFGNCSRLTSAPSLPATTLAEYCYFIMFSGCSSLTSAPELSATILAKGCYYLMFSGCSSLRSAPSLPATTLAENCYWGMFSGCSSLTSAPSLPATILAGGCYCMMFEFCSSLTNAPSLPATTLAKDCYNQMFTKCTSLTNAPSLPATTLVDKCYYYMFNNCTNLNQITMLATDITANNCLYNWVRGVSTTGTFIKSPEMISLPRNENGIPSGWRVKDYEDDGNLENPKEGEESEW